MLFEISIIVFLLILNSFFAMSEMAIVSSNRSLLRQMARQGNKGAQLALDLAEDSGRFLSTVQVGITLVGILAGAYGGATIAEKLKDDFNAIAFITPHGEAVAVGLVVSLLTYFSVVVGELVPKQFALSNSERLAIFVARPMMLLSKLCTPIVMVLERSADGVMAVLGIKKRGEDHVTEAEVKAVLSGGAESGAIEKSEYDMLQRIIRLDDRDVKSIMTHRMDTIFIDMQDSAETVKEKIKQARHARYPVTDGSVDKVIGFVEVRDLYDALLVNDDFKIENYLRNVGILPETSHCLEALELFKRSDMKVALVLDEYGTTQGIVTAADLLEAIVGVFPANYDDASDHTQVVQREDGSWLVDGMTPINEIHLTIGLEDIKDTGEYDTIAGFLLHASGKIPEEGDRFEKFGHRFEVIDMDGRRIDKILIQRVVEDA